MANPRDAEHGDDTRFPDRFPELEDIPHVEILLVDAHGSTPADAGARMVVTEAGRHAGTVGGGRLEAKAIAEAQEMLRTGGSTRFRDWNLRRDVGMTCGGTVKLYLESHNASDWRIAVFGAGHVTQAVARVLVQLPCRLTCIDPRADWLAQLPEGVETRHRGEPGVPAEVDTLPDRTHVLCMTRGHAADRPVLRRIFETGRGFAFLGVIGSAAKAATLRRELEKEGVPADRIAFECPVGLPIGGNHPAEIAVSITARLLQARDAPRPRTAGAKPPRA
ncbi:xanthine dehydrogenase accessory protein XdhC [Phycisphaera mikurensis]|uniref:Xanthine dehydrogenase accessory protein n=1 Tax=Phycisphaera mikurensis (strain NBRC 102666 / KCTC 22515 / FYK2301M01) TaxID=1142394 RepID=I0IIY8_PHYMF|nr:xanthine dehydrogenase accessory protein XdhC [Phycisphaera mikurensis]MBB6443073.1 xanthine dehydrogenase accessory factor [Phycisphaera mikurensis]BAM05226.1 xanthine dehydrogenase accessory protein [Phycisphaera mikurensis NBRC 102666]